LHSLDGTGVLSLDPGQQTRRESSIVDMEELVKSFVDMASWRPSAPSPGPGEKGQKGGPQLLGSSNILQNLLFLPLELTIEIMQDVTQRLAGS
jgi:hypothetical protein